MTTSNKNIIVFAVAALPALTLLELAAEAE
jgi:hypothetical protein